MNSVAIGTAFVGGLVSFLAPCILPIIPGFLVYLAGSTTSGGEPPRRLEVFLQSLFFVLGFSVVFALIGVLLNSKAFQLYAHSAQSWLGYFGGAVIIFFGLYLTGLIRLPFLDRDYKFGVKRSKLGGWHRSLTSFVFGIAFAAGWSPCVGPVLAIILGLALSNPGSAFVLLLTYALGLGLPFLVVGLFTGEATKLITRFGGSLKVVNIIFGALLIIIGIFVFTGTLPLILGNLSWL